ncbi:probable RNA methyltransferase CG11342 [Phlebotomus argentipes]|uniref:probable RNA methyltransferase CG11342 n=1 Tax=Phlebotomus argentipes TaxID=94469 RepID=UPI0028937EA7|nr:probable RNA methyltransferase CG11342 [Phlebotomus argentipes]
MANGAVKFGNFINYYQFNTPEERLAVFPTHLWNNWRSPDDKLLVLDVGCNAGNFTQLFYKFLTEHSGREVFILGIDIDPILIERSQESNAYPSNIRYSTLDFMKDSNECIKEFLSFHVREKFDVTLCLSITMWIHLNHGDDGLWTFLRRVSSLSEVLVVEPQPWKCYQTATRRMTRANEEEFPLYRLLKNRTGVDITISKFLVSDCGKILIYESPETKWKRRVYVYREQ